MQQPRSTLPLAVVALVVLALTAASAADNWPAFRGTRAGVIPDDPALPDTWDTKENVRWKFNVPGLGWSSPIVWGDNIFVTSVISDEPPPVPGQDLIDDVKVVSYKEGMSRKPSDNPYRWMLYAIDFNTGKLRWQRE